MLRFVPELAREKPPVIVLCGVDGCAGTEIVERLLERGGDRWAVISNRIDGPEFAAVAVDRVAGQMVPHAIGCLCCVTRSGLVSSLRRLHARRAQGEIDFDQVLIETLPDADPAPVMQTLLNNALVTEYFRLDSVVTVLPDAGTDAVVGARYGGKQLALADRIVLDPGALDTPGTRACLQRLSPSAGRVFSDRPILAQTLLGAGLEARLLNHDLGHWLASAHYHDRDRLDGGLHGFAIEFAHALDWDALHGWLNAGTRTNGDIMYRTKGAIRVEGMDGAVILNGVQHVFQPPQQVPGATVDRSRLLFITADLDRAAVETSLRDDLPQFLRLSRERADRAARVAADPSIPF